MKFEEAFDKVFVDTPPEHRPQGDPVYPRLLAFLWSMIAVADGNVDDIAYIDQNKDIVSIPVKKSKEPKKPKEPKETKKVQKSSPEKTVPLQEEDNINGEGDSGSSN